MPCAAQSAFSGLMVRLDSWSADASSDMAAPE